MSDTIREQIHAKIADMLDDGLPTHFSGGITVERNRDAGVQRFPSVIVIDGSQTRDQPESTGETLYTVFPIVEGHVQVETPAELGPALSELYGRVIQVLMADRKLGGLAIDMTEEELTVDIGRREGQRPAAAFSIDLEVKFCTAEDDPYEIGPGV